MTHVHRCPRCGADHDRRARCAGSELCTEQKMLPLGEVVACILDHDHTGPHWGPTPSNPDKYQEWPK